MIFIFQIAFVFIFHGLSHVVQMFLLFYRCTNSISMTHHEADTLGIVEAGGAGLDVGPSLLELAEDGLIAFLAVDVAEKLAVEIVMAFAEVAIRGYHHTTAVVIGHAAIQSDVLRQII
jgi:hypothetical protein